AIVRARCRWPRTCAPDSGRHRGCRDFARREAHRDRRRRSVGQARDLFDGRRVASSDYAFKGLFNVAYEPGRWVGDNVTPELAANGYTGNPTLLFWETHADLGGPIKKDRLWFFYAFNHFTIDKVVSGVPRSLGTDLGIFDNHTVKGTWRP